MCSIFWRRYSNTFLCIFVILAAICIFPFHSISSLLWALFSWSNNVLTGWKRIRDNWYEELNFLRPPKLPKRIGVFNPVQQDVRPECWVQQTYCPAMCFKRTVFAIMDTEITAENTSSIICCQMFFAAWLSTLWVEFAFQIRWNRCLLFLIGSTHYLSLSLLLFVRLYYCSENFAFWHSFLISATGFVRSFFSLNL